jgi:hypothetical protein
MNAPEDSDIQNLKNFLWRAYELKWTVEPADPYQHVLEKFNLCSSKPRSKKGHTSGSPAPLAET